MDYQESFRPIEHLAEAAGIRRAIEDYKHHPDLPEYCTYYCASRKRRTKSLFVRIGGQRCQVHIVADIDLDYCIPYGEIYADYYEDIDEALVDNAARERPDLADKGYREVASDFERAADWEREQKRRRREAADALKPLIEAYLKDNGPSSSWELCFSVQHAHEHSMEDALRELENRGYLIIRYGQRRDRYWFADETIAGSFEDALASAPSIEEKVEHALSREGPSSVRDLTSCIDVSDGRIRKALNILVEQNRAVVDKTGSVFVFGLVDGQSGT